MIHFFKKPVKFPFIGYICSEGLYFTNREEDAIKLVSLSGLAIHSLEYLLFFIGTIFLSSW